jgi:ubiquinone/menaquinone biosynthesis C-methylase UbiE
MTPTDASSEYFEQVAENWDEMSAKYFNSAIREAAIAKAYLRPEMVVADIGSGTGYLAAALAPIVRQVHVVDRSPAMLDVAKKNLNAFSNIEYHQSEGTNLPFDADRLDAVFANMYLHHMADPAAAIREMVRVLRPGGRLVITDKDAHAHSWLKEEMADVWQGFEREQVRGWLAEAELVNVIVDSTGQCCCAESSNPALSEDEGRNVTMSVFVATGTRRMAMRAAVQESYSAVAQSGSCGCSSSSAEISEGCCGASESSDSACCGSNSTGSCCSGAQYEDVAFSTGYSQNELSSAPAEAAEISLGCGNPIALAGLKAGEVVLDIGSGGGVLSLLIAGQKEVAAVTGIEIQPELVEMSRRKF